MSWSLQGVDGNLSGSEEPLNNSDLVKDSLTNSSNISFSDQPFSEELHTPAYIPICVGIANGIVFFTGIIGNSLVMLVVCRVKEMRSSTNYFLISLSAADALVLLICQPSAILEFYAQDRWLLGPQMCKLVPFLENAVAYTSILTLLVISIERYVAICHPFAVHTTFTEKKTAKTVFAVWAAAFAISLPFIVLTGEETAIFHDKSVVKVCKTRIQDSWHHFYLLFTVIMLFFVPMAVLIALYTCILLKLRTENMEIGQCSTERRDRRQVVIILISVIVLFFVCLLPVRVLTLWKVYTSTTNIEALGLEGYLNLIWFVRIMMYINSAGNPIRLSFAVYRSLSAAGGVSDAVAVFGVLSLLFHRRTLRIIAIWTDLSQTSWSGGTEWVSRTPSATGNPGAFSVSIARTHRRTNLHDGCTNLSTKTPQLYIVSETLN